MGLLQIHNKRTLIANAFLLVICLAFAAPAYSNVAQAETCTEWKAEQDKEDLMEKEFVPNGTTALKRELAKFIALTHHVSFAGIDQLPIPTPPPEQA